MGILVQVILFLMNFHIPYVYFAIHLAEAPLIGWCQAPTRILDPPLMYTHVLYQARMKLVQELIYQRMSGNSFVKHICLMGQVMKILGCTMMDL
jgi:hypothetical protein